jgi:hypothetical protein
MAEINPPVVPGCQGALSKIELPAGIATPQPVLAAAPLPVAVFAFKFTITAVDVFGELIHTSDPQGAGKLVFAAVTALTLPITTEHPGWKGFPRDKAKHSYLIRGLRPYLLA